LWNEIVEPPLRFDPPGHRLFTNAPIVVKWISKNLLRRRALARRGAARSALPAQFSMGDHSSDSSVARAAALFMISRKSTVA
jgi:hypothetical protein